ncbi:hypothetical protein [Haloarchaeobius sp. DFWS5]|uniref:hypothetical protein n=1 Tax=Haloarchaeobius sp. DFWS5 TaxID=3446114 RepID=UPI003EB9DAEB
MDEATLAAHAATQLGCDEDAAAEFLDTLEHAVGSVCPLCGDGYIVEADDDRWFPSRGRQSRTVNLGLMELSLSKGRELKDDDATGLSNPYFCSSGHDTKRCVLSGQFVETVAVNTVRGVEETARRRARRDDYTETRLDRARERLD